MIGSNNQLTMHDPMKRKNLLNMLLLAALTFMAACQSNEPEKKIKYIAHATIEQGDEAAAGGPARIAATHLDGNDQQGYKVCWSEGDQFTLLAENGSFTFGLIGGENSTHGTFAFEGSQQLSGNEFVAYYPTTLDYNQGTPNWPTRQHFVPGGCAEAPMMADITGTPTQWNHDGLTEVTLPDLHFTNLGGLLRLSTSGTNVFYAKAIAFHSDQINVTLDCGGVLVDANHYAFIALPAGTYSGVSLTFTGYDGTEITKALKEGKQIVIERSKISPIAVPVNYTIPAPEAPEYQEVGGVEVATVDFAGGQTFSWYALMGNGDLVKAIWGNDWRMPTEEELLSLGLTGRYWSSDSNQANDNEAWGYINGTGGSGKSSYPKTTYAKVRPVYVGHANNQISE